MQTQLGANILLRPLKLHDYHSVLNEFLEWLVPFADICIVHEDLKWNFVDDGTRDGWQNEFAACMEQQENRFIVIHIILQGEGEYHSNVIVVDRVRMAAERYDPHGGSMTKFETNLLDEKLVKYFGLYGITYHAIDTDCPFKGLQFWEQIEDDKVRRVLGSTDEDSGYCFFFVLFYIHARISPDFRDLDFKAAQIAIKKNVQDLGEGIGLYIRKFSNWIIDEMYEIKGRGSEIQATFRPERNQRSKPRVPGDYMQIPDYRRRSQVSGYNLRDGPGSQTPRVTPRQRSLLPRVIQHEAHGEQVPQFVATNQAMPRRFFEMSATRAPAGAWTVYDQQVYHRRFNPVERQADWVQDNIPVTPTEVNELRKVWKARIQSLTLEQFGQLAMGFPRTGKLRYRDHLYQTVGAIHTMSGPLVLPHISPEGNWQLIGTFDPPGSDNLVKVDWHKEIFAFVIGGQLHFEEYS